ncbi:hypothetical protein SynWH8103_02788 [Synechococcus sp. WH 8103]|nr:hypothetical protein SynWH8103_02788 [Synechococcus sp. WH 8103]
MICWRPWLEEVASTGVAAVGAMQKPRLTTPPELIRQRTVVAEQRGVVEGAVAVFEPTTSASVLTP